MEDTPNKDTTEKLVSGSQKPASKKPRARKRVLILVVTLALIVGGLYVYGMYRDANRGLDTTVGGVANPDEFKFDYEDKEREKRLREFKNKSSDDFSSEQERLVYYQEYNALLAIEGKCDEFEKNLEELSKRVAIDADGYLALARCYETNDGSKADINRAADKAEASLSESETEEDRTYFEDRIRYYRSFDV